MPKAAGRDPYMYRELGRDQAKAITCLLVSLSGLAGRGRGDHSREPRHLHVARYLRPPTRSHIHVSRAVGCSTSQDLSTRLHAREDLRLLMKFWGPRTLRVFVQADRKSRCRRDRRTRTRVRYERTLSSACPREATYSPEKRVLRRRGCKPTRRLPSLPHRD